MSPDLATSHLIAYWQGQAFAAGMTFFCAIAGVAACKSQRACVRHTRRSQRTPRHSPLAR
ncbi:hypothetical protein EPN42_04505 [bacterium]|nr:MAG: hypothetical protein EPN42_04505 [bacterium]